jgi:hypothetical protein
MRVVVELDHTYRLVVRIALGLLVILVAVPVASAAGRPSPSSCAVAWNAWAPLGLHKLIAKNSVRAAFIDAHASVGTDTLSPPGATSNLPGCTIQFVLPGGAFRVHRGTLAQPSFLVPRQRSSSRSS